MTVTMMRAVTRTVTTASVLSLSLRSRLSTNTGINVAENTPPSRRS